MCQTFRYFLVVPSRRQYGNSNTLREKHCPRQTEEKVLLLEVIKYAEGKTSGDEWKAKLTQKERPKLSQTWKATHGESENFPLSLQGNLTRHVCNQKLMTE